MNNDGHLYDRLKAAGCEIDNHESDLYVRWDQTAEVLVKDSGCSFQMFRHAVTGELWADIAFMYLPWWEKRQAARDAAEGGGE